MLETSPHNSIELENSIKAINYLWLKGKNLEISLKLHTLQKWKKLNGENEEDEVFSQTTWKHSHLHTWCRKWKERRERGLGFWKWRMNSLKFIPNLINKILHLSPLLFPHLKLKSNGWPFYPFEVKCYRAYYEN